MNDIIVYHGSTQIVEFPEIRIAKYNQDFYFGFYCTIMPEQAKRWATRFIINEYLYIQEKANLIWEIATHLVGLFKPHEYGKVILPMTVLKRFDDALALTKQKVVEMGEKLAGMKVEGEARDGVLCKTSGYSFYNTSKFDFKKLVSDPDNIESNFENYMQGFSSNVKDIISNFKFTDQVRTMADGNVLF